MSYLCSWVWEPPGGGSLVTTTKTMPANSLHEARVDATDAVCNGGADRPSSDHALIALSVTEAS